MALHFGVVGVKECGLLACPGEHDINKGDEVMFLQSRIPEVSGTVLFPANDNGNGPNIFVYILELAKNNFH